ncbi:MAG: DUF2442 domain-containing protein [Myxococcales bacterium]|nr:DUF2442 domain-containing protein [Myxococcales bacterium]
MRAFVVHLAFTDGSHAELDLEAVMQGPVFDAIRADAALFREVFVEPQAGTIAWPNGADLCPDVLHALATTGSPVPGWARTEAGGTTAA